MQYRRVGGAAQLEEEPRGGAVSGSVPAITVQGLFEDPGSTRRPSTASSGSSGNRGLTPLLVRTALEPRIAQRNR